MTLSVDRLWYGAGRPLWFLWPLAWLFRRVARARRDRAVSQPPNPKLTLPVVVVGNITAGGTGKSPLTAWLVETLREAGWSPVILTRGYGGSSDHYPLLVSPDSDPAEAGDEPVMLAQQCGCPVVVDPKRYRGGQWAIREQLGNILVCDDGLQHYALPRDLELAVFDGQRGIGNGAPIPVGPLREPVDRLESVDFVITNGQLPLPLEHRAQFCMALKPALIRNLCSGESQPLEWLQGRKVRAVAGIGNPQRFFDTLAELGALVRSRALPDHHRFRGEDLETAQDEVLLMTAKDAVKCKAIAPANTWVLEVRAELPEAFRKDLLDRLQ
ncbi:tetraacyldisaccharide 4'-kinase [Marinobacter zhejiangensis]|uniref:Tetraacyldisaccharide 4'-kinase n=1 Tax=Marinobacter zhejiangensis TaxID=488535 RepID=A0A1I4RJJ1_9GAMM|nr:tetraacyldisaccharide 4'-kinase [Marinobacter zhejiangensis]SFM52153.1 lipid-A-disaccharide kinase [Marinobacter zhejiangensis]